MKKELLELYDQTKSPDAAKEKIALLKGIDIAWMEQIGRWNACGSVSVIRDMRR